LNTRRSVSGQPVAIGTETDEGAVIVGTPVLTWIGHTAVTLVDVCNTQNETHTIRASTIKQDYDKKSNKQNHHDNIFQQ
jgi:hypothetical protein